MLLYWIQHHGRMCIKSPIERRALELNDLFQIREDLRLWIVPSRKKRLVEGEKRAQMSIGCIKRLSESWLICNQRVCRRLGGARRPERRREIEGISSGYATEADGSGFLIVVCRWHDEISLISRSTSPPRASRGRHRQFAEGKKDAAE